MLIWLKKSEHYEVENKNDVTFGDMEIEKESALLP